MGSLCIQDTLKALSDDKSLELFNIVVFALPRDASIVTTRLGLTRRQYYWRMNRLIDAGLVMRKKGRHLLTSLGKVVYEYLILIVHAIENYWKLKIIDLIERSFLDNGISAEGRRKMIDTLIENNNIKNIVLNYNFPSNQRYKIRHKQVLKSRRYLNFDTLRNCKRNAYKCR